MSWTAVSKKVDSIVEDLLFSVKREQVEEIFNKNDIDDKSERILLLQKCMGVTGTSNTIDNALSIEDAYNDELAIFLNGKWRMVV